MSLHDEVEKFRIWADSNFPGDRSGEWECLYPDWNDLDAAAKATLKNPTGSWNKHEVADIIFAIARDNEDQSIVEMVAEEPERLLLLANYSLSSDESDAKWQLADRLGLLQSKKNEAESLLLQFVRDEDEYVRRRALLALGAIKSGQAETLAERAWETGHEYQQIAALDVLKEIGSPKLTYYANKALEDGRTYLVKKANEVLHSLR